MVQADSFYGIDLSGTAAFAVDVDTAGLTVFEQLRPMSSATPLIRVGGDGDGAYLVPDDLGGIEACFSPGVNRIKYFEDALTDRYGISSHMCDFTCDVDDFTTPLRPGRQTFAKKWLDVSPGADNISLADWMRDTAVDGDLLLQMDIEGAEYRNILGTSDETLARFRVIVLEVHGLHRMRDPSVLGEVIGPFFAKLSNLFTCVHAHPNNCCGDFPIPGTDVRIPRVLELTMVRHDRFVPAPGTPLLPHPLDISRNVADKPPLFLGEAWVDHRRPLESRVKMLEDTVAAQNSHRGSDIDGETAGMLALTMRSLQTLMPEPGRPSGEMVEVAEGSQYRLSSAYGSSSRNDVVKPSDTYFFHTGFGPNPSIRIDLGRQRRVRRIELTNRRNGHQQRANYVFVTLSDRADGTDAAHVYPMYRPGDLAGGAWQHNAIDVPETPARYVTVTTPMNTALHLADVRIYAATGGVGTRPSAASARAVTAWGRQLARQAAHRAPRPVQELGRRLLRRR